MRPLRRIPFIIVIFLATVRLTFADQNCFTIVVGKEASADGWVIMAHNEDDAAPQAVNHLKVPPGDGAVRETVTLYNGGQITFSGERLGYFHAELPGMLFSDSFLKEKGVCITSDACPSREDQPVLTDGGITKKLRQLVAQRASTAREGVKLAGRLVERFGYGSSGRTYIISDPNEGWLFAVVNGKHWAAQRVPDDEVAVIANTYSIHEMDLPDTLNFLASSDIISYAEERGWYDPERDGEFDFAAVYALSRAATDSGNFCRQWAGLNHFTEEPVPLSMDLPFSVRPQGKISVPDVMQALRDHYEGTPLATEPHKGGINTICNRSTMTSFIAQLRGDMPADIGLVYWVTLAPPCASVYVPFPFGISGFPAGYYTGEKRPSIEAFEKRVSAPFNANPAEAFWTFINFFNRLEQVNSTGIVFLREVEKNAIAGQDSMEEIALDLYRQGKTDYRDVLETYSTDIYDQALKAMSKAFSEK
jgi:dipeptidase